MAAPSPSATAARWAWPRRRFRFDDRRACSRRTSQASRPRGLGRAARPGHPQPHGRGDEEPLRAPRAAVYKSGDDVKLLDPAEAYETIEVPGRGLRWVGPRGHLLPRAPSPEGRPRQGGVPAGAGRADDRRRPTSSRCRRRTTSPRSRRISPGVLARAASRPATRSPSSPIWGSKELRPAGGAPLRPREHGRSSGSSASWPGRSWPALHWIHDHVVANYGWAIILMTVLIKLVLLPRDPHQHDVDAQDAGAQPEDAGHPGQVPDEAAATSRGSRTWRCSAR